MSNIISRFFFCFQTKKAYQNSLKWYLTILRTFPFLNLNTPWCTNGQNASSSLSMCFFFFCEILLFKHLLTFHSLYYQRFWEVAVSIFLCFRPDIWMIWNVKNTSWLYSSLVVGAGDVFLFPNIKCYLIYLFQALESSSSLIIEFRGEEEKVVWLKGLIQATYQASVWYKISVNLISQLIVSSDIVTENLYLFSI